MLLEKHLHIFVFRPLINRVSHYTDNHFYSGIIREDELITQKLKDNLSIIGANKFD